MKARSEDISRETEIQLKEVMTKTKILENQSYYIVPQNDVEYSVPSNHPDLYSR